MKNIAGNAGTRHRFLRETFGIYMEIRPRVARVRKRSCRALAPSHGKWKCIFTPRAPPPPPSLSLSLSPSFLPSGIPRAGLIPESYGNEAFPALLYPCRREPNVQRSIECSRQPEIPSPYRLIPSRGADSAEKSARLPCIPIRGRRRARERSVCRSV
jgi:hypothetical protein